MVNQLSTEDRALLLNNIFIQMFDNQDFEVFLATMEKRYELAFDPKKKELLFDIIKHFRELMTLRPRMMEFKNLMKKTVNEIQA